MVQSLLINDMKMMSIYANGTAIRKGNMALNDIKKYMAFQKS